MIAKLGDLTRPAAEKAVGPESAGAEPDPVCYDRGGTEPTVTEPA